MQLKGRCGNCKNCKIIQKVQGGVLACCNPPFVHADDDVVMVWNDQLKRFPCLQEKLLIIGNDDDYE